MLCMFRLTGDAKLWWKEHRRDNPTSSPSWEAMKQAVKERYLPPAHQALKMNELFALWQLGLTLEEYYSKFVSLRRYAPQMTMEQQIASVSTIENLDKAKELKEEPIDLALEEKVSANLDVAIFKAQNVVNEPTEDITILETSLTLVHLSSFHLNGKVYITLHSIQSLFNIREHYCLAAIIEASQVTNYFVDIEGESKEEFLALDLETSNQNFFEAPHAFDLCLKRVVVEELTLKDEDFEARLVELGIDKFERNVLEPNKIKSDLGAKINLEHKD
ncbi:hypothetical protein L7F22_029940 [Adiantum nelumboides]|nr:hypothetical protein [Adiantum nelumboides]